MINWAAIVDNALNEGFESLFKKQGIPHYVDSQVKKAQVKIPNFTEVVWQPVPKHFQAQTITDYSSQTPIDVYQWNGVSALQKVAVIVDKQEGNFAGIIDDGSTMLYVANVGCHPIVATDNLIFLNSDGSTFIQFPKQLFKDNGAKVVEYLVETANKFIFNQSH